MSIHDEIRSGISCVFTLTFTLPDELVYWLEEASPDDLRSFDLDLYAVHQALHCHSAHESERSFDYHTFDAAQRARARILIVLGEYTAKARQWWQSRQDPQP